jgi:hypothetical protein
MIDWLSIHHYVKETIHTSMRTHSTNHNCAYFKNYSCTPLSTITTDYIDLNKARVKPICMQSFSLTKEYSWWQ